MVPFRTISLGQQRLKASLSRSSAATAHLEYGALLHVRRERTRATLGIITLSGESLPLTPRLLAALADKPLHLAGQTRVSLGFLNPGVLAEPDRPLDTLLLQVLPDESAPLLYEGDGDGDARDVLAGVEALVSADTLLQPLVLLMPSRPAGWPR